MKKNFRRKLFIIMLLFAFSISLIISIVDYIRIKENAIKSNERQIKNIENITEQTLKTIEKVYYYYDAETARRMLANTYDLLDKYDKNPNFDEWDFDLLREKYSMDVYIINQKNVITHSSFSEDIGLDFNKCCPKLESILDQRRASSLFYHDGIDLEQETGKVKKYSYMATRDKKYIIQLGISLESTEIFKEFNFLKMNEELAEKYPCIDKINILNIEGYPLGKPVADNGLPKKRKEAFERALETKQNVEVRDETGPKPIIYRYVPYISAYDTGSTQYKVIEIIYNENTIQSIFKQNRKSFFIQILIILVTTTIVSLIISKWAAKPIYLAYHDSLTGLKNRTAFEDFSQSQFDCKGNGAFFMIDLDNFKKVNDYLGHDVGDVILKRVAEVIRKTVGPHGEVFRYGGDEFIVLFNSNQKKEVDNKAKQLISAVENLIMHTNQFIEKKVTVSIGIALTPQHGQDAKTLYKKADIALYTAKGKGKNQYYFFDEALIKSRDND